ADTLAPTPPTTWGLSGARVIVDELAPFPNNSEPVATVSFRDKRFPEADVVVMEEVLTRHHARNPNPDAGVVKEYVMIVGGRRSHPERSLAVAKINAESLHKRLVSELIKDQEQRMPGFGAFG